MSLTWLILGLITFQPESCRCSFCSQWFEYWFRSPFFAPWAWTLAQTPPTNLNLGCRTWHLLQWSRPFQSKYPSWRPPSSDLEWCSGSGEFGFSGYHRSTCWKSSAWRYSRRLLSNFTENYSPACIGNTDRGPGRLCELCTWWIRSFSLLAIPLSHCELKNRSCWDYCCK